MLLNTVRALTVLLVAVAMAPAFAHLFELPHNIHLSSTDYLTVQQIYRGWSLLGIVVVGALLCSLALTVIVRHRPTAFALSVAAFLCITATQVLFWVFAFPANQQTANWTQLPAN